MSVKMQTLGTFSTLQFTPSTTTEGDLQLFTQEVKPKIEETLENYISCEGPQKFYWKIKTQIYKEDAEGKVTYSPFYVSVKAQKLLRRDEIEGQVSHAIEETLLNFEDVVIKGSGWALSKIYHLDLYMAKYKPLHASSYFASPSHLKNKRAVVNIQNFRDEKCFLWSMIAHRRNIPYQDHPERLSHYEPYEDQFNMQGIQYPVSFNDIPTIEKNNNIRINVFSYDKRCIIPNYTSERTDADSCNLLLLWNGEERHYCLIRDLSRLVGDQTNHQHRMYVCPRCVHRFVRQDLLDEHEVYCRKHSCQRIDYPEEGRNQLKFTTLNYQHPVEFIVYADFECVLEPIDTCEPSPAQSSSTNVNHHKPCGYCLQVVHRGQGLWDPIVYNEKRGGVDTVEQFIQDLLRLRSQIEEKLFTNVPLVVTDDILNLIPLAEECSICGRAFLNEDEKVLDHDHLDGSFRGIAHNKCNLNYRLTKKVPVVFHNMSGYDGHLIIKELAKLEDHTTRLVATDMENYISFSLQQKSSDREDKQKIRYQFIDSKRFLNSSLDALAKNLDKTRDFKILSQYFPIEAQRKLVMEKGVYPYEYMDSVDRFAETCLPPKAAFYSSLKGEDISQAEYDRLGQVWEKFGLSNLGDLHDVYVKTDVLLLADVFENFRALCKRTYDLDPAHFMTAPGLAWQAALKYTKVELDLLTDPNMFLFVEQGLRGGICQISHRHAVANNKHLGDLYDSTRPSTYIGYLDANNLYGWAMSQALPHYDFHWVEDVSQINEVTIQNLTDDGNLGMILEVDLDYPQELHDRHNDYPLAPESVKIERGMLSPYATDLVDHKLGGHFTSSRKLVTHLKGRKNYIVHYRNLKQYLDLGLKLTKIHKVLEFQQSAWLEPYIVMNTAKRAASKNAFEKDFYKLMINSVFGKTMENLRNRIRVDIVTNEKKAQKLVMDPTFKAFKIFEEGVVGVERAVGKIVMNKPTYVGFSVLDISKVLMYDFHYNTIKAQYGDRARLLFTDTDSLAYLIQTDDLYADMYAQKHLYDFSDYPLGEAGHFCHNNDNKKVIGKFKDELKAVPIREFIGLRPKMYSVLPLSGGDKKVAKGVSKAYISKNLTHQGYRDCLLNSRISRGPQMRIGHENHELYTIRQNKITLSPLDDKRYLWDDGITSYAYGHYRISEAMDTT